MRKFTPWLGLCHLRQVADASTNSQPTLVAVWADSVECFEREMHVHTNARGQQMIWAEDVLPAEEWQASHPDRNDAQRLAAKVSKPHPVQIGALDASATRMGATGMEADGTPDGDAEGYLHIEAIEGVGPLGGQFGVYPPKTVPDALHVPLFGQPDPTKAEVAQYGSAEAVPPLNTYAILDAAKVVNFVEMLEASGLEYRCLFKGKVAKEMRDVAPYVVRLEEDNDFTGNLFSHDPERDVPWFMWSKEPGIYIRSRGSLEDMWGHFRKFTKVQDEDGKWFYFRFWESPVSTRLLSLGNDPELQQLISPMFPVGKRALSILILSQYMTVSLSRTSDSKPTRARPVMTKAVQEAMRHIRKIHEFEKLIKISIRHIPLALREKEDEVTQHLRSKRNIFYNLGFWRRDHLTKLCCWEVMLGPDFLQTYAQKKIWHIITTTKAAHVAIAQIEAFLDKQAEDEKEQSETGKDWTGKDWTGA